MEAHGPALVTARQVDPFDLAGRYQIAKPGFPDAEICRGGSKPEQGRLYLPLPSMVHGGGL